MISIIHELRKTSSRNAKIAILEKHSDDKEWKKYLLAVYHPYINYYLKSVNDTTFLDAGEHLTLGYNWMYEVLQQLTDREVTGNAARDLAKDCSMQYGELFRLILGGSVKAGITATSINAAYPGLIPVFKRLKGDEYEITEFPILMSTKFDGMWVGIRVEDQEVTLQSSSGMYFKLPSLSRRFVLQPNGWYEGEMVKGDGKTVSRSSITGDFNKVTKGTATDIKDYSYMVFDYLALEEWDNKVAILTFDERLCYLKDNLGTCNIVKVAEQISVPDQEGIDVIYADLVERGYEGLIGRYGQDPYTWNTASKRSKRVIKKKEKKDATLHCIGVIEGKGKYAGMIGSLICRGVVEGKPIDVDIGVGLSDWDRDQEPVYYIGEEIEVIYNSITEQDGEYSLFLARVPKGDRIQFKRLKGEA